jgi:hypothetical protein
MSPNHHSSAGRRWAIRLGPVAAVIAAAAAMLANSWGKWPDVLVDFGRELYVPWVLSQGRVLYRDVMYFNGPLSPYLNSLWFDFFGPSLWTLVWANLTILALLTLLIYRVLRSAGSRISAFAALALFFLVFAFSQLVRLGNYNYVCPYSHEATHGMLFAWAALAALSSHARSQQPRWLAGAGVATGLVFLTKPEIFAATALAAAISLLLWARAIRPGARGAIRAIGLFAAACALPSLVSFLGLSTAMPWKEAGIGTLGGWWYVADGRISGLPFYRDRMGIDAPLYNLNRMIEAGGVYAAVLVPAAALALIARRRRLAIVAGTIVAAAVVLAAWLLRADLPWYGLGRPMPVFLLAASVVFAWLSSRRPNEKHDAALVLAVFALGLLAKIFLNARFYHYGFVLAMPAALVLVLALLDWIPGLLERARGRKGVFLAGAVSLLGVIAVWHVNHSVALYARKDFPIGRGRDRFLVGERGRMVGEAVDWLETNTRPEDTVVVLPEGAMINFVTRRENPTSIVSLMPPEWLMFGEERFLEALRADPPDYVVLAHKNTSEYGYRFFGVDYGRSVAQWLNEGYAAVRSFGAVPFREDRFGILIARRKAEVEPIH